MILYCKFTSELSRSSCICQTSHMFPGLCLCDFANHSLYLDMHLFLFRYKTNLINTKVMPEVFLLCRNDEARQPLSRKVPIPSSKLNPYRMVIALRLVVLGIFFHYRITNPVNNAYPLWLVSVICEIWFAISWILDQFPKWLPINRETYLDRLSLRQGPLPCQNFIC